MMTNTTLADPHKNVLRLSPQRQNDQLSTTAPRRMMRYPRRQLPARDEYRDTDGGADDDMAVLTARLFHVFSFSPDISQLTQLPLDKPGTCFWHPGYMGAAGTPYRKACHYYDADAS
ncbi:hypothetical protein TEQG_01655 [Trichophyton equinum CBS 127.97]|uniref:Uncharacterized protein n=1 Tax=Trichophyton equinum (strain ATCC MYA-4606 / CBS 127.97) TaxID=559882 RepID=F2PL22_TRIEC|nr:hypothetical protein TEQG_01655 [Trichophyton equinum CBS 127.97]